MLTIHSHRASRDCQGTSRRDFLKVGALGATGLTLPALLRAKAEAATGRGGGFVRDKSVVFLFLAGGPSQYETFDPKMNAPAEIRSVTGEVSTSLPGVTFGGTFPELARRADRMAIVRSFKVNNTEHCKAAIEMLTGGLVNPRGNSLEGEQGGSMGSIYSRLRGTKSIYVY